jgi:2-isopropylmalate synthase
MKPFAGWNIRAHASGIHQKHLSVHSLSSTNPVFPPQRIVLSRHSGRAGVILAASEYGLSLTNDCAGKILDRIKALPERMVSGSQFLTLMAQTLPQNHGENVADNKFLEQTFLVCTDFSLNHSGEQCHVFVTLVEQPLYRSLCATAHSIFSGVGETSMEAVSDVVQKIAGLSVHLTVVEWSGINGQCRCYAEFQLPDGTLDAVERTGTFPEKMFFGCCLDVMNRFRFRNNTDGNPKSFAGGDPCVRPVSHDEIV